MLKLKKKLTKINNSYKLQDTANQIIDNLDLDNRTPIIY